MTTICLTDNTSQQNGSSDSTAATTGDTMLRDFAPTTNYSTDAELINACDGSSNPTQTIILGFDLAFLSGATINSATLYLKQKNGGNNDTQTWSTHLIQQSGASISTMTWNTYDGSTSWDTAGASGAGDQTSALSSGSIAADFTNDVYRSFSITATIQAVADGTSNYGLHLRMGGTAGGARVYDSGNGTDGDRPELVIDYTAGSGEVAGIEVVRTIAGVTH